MATDNFWYGSVGVETGYGMNGRGLITGMGIFLLSAAFRLVLRLTQPPVVLSPGA
jgi:hypothetical protein